MTKTLTKSTSGKRLIYNNNGNIENIIIDKIDRFHKLNAVRISLRLTGDRIMLNFDTEADRDTAYDLIEGEF